MAKKKSYDTSYTEHSADCWKIHHACAVKRIEEIKLLMQTVLEGDGISQSAEGMHVHKLISEALNGLG